MGSYVGKIFKWLGAVILILFTFGAIWITHAYWKGYTCARAYDRVRQGDSEAAVRTLLGSPYKITGRPENVVWDSDATIRPNNGECIREFWYDPPISFTGEEWTVGFDVHSNVVSKYHYISP